MIFRRSVGNKLSSTRQCPIKLLPRPGKLQIPTLSRGKYLCIGNKRREIKISDRQKVEKLVVLHHQRIAKWISLGTGTQVIRLARPWAKLR